LCSPNSNRIWFAVDSKVDSKKLTVAMKKRLELPPVMAAAVAAVHALHLN
jgi:hypothetical protein